MKTEKEIGERLKKIKIEGENMNKYFLLLIGVILFFFAMIKDSKVDSLACLIGVIILLTGFTICEEIENFMKILQKNKDSND